MMKSENPYSIAQSAIADLKTAIYMILEKSESGMTNVDIGKSLGIYQGHIKHEGHIPRTLLALMEHEGVVEQINENKKWKLKEFIK